MSDEITSAGLRTVEVTDCSGQNVGAGLPANALIQSKMYRLARRIRDQGRSHNEFM